jgi:hypothetical protein
MARPVGGVVVGHGNHLNVTHKKQNIIDEAVHATECYSKMMNMNNKYTLLRRHIICFTPRVNTRRGCSQVAEASFSNQMASRGRLATVDIADEHNTC